MSRSRRKPYEYICGGTPVKPDRQVAARAVRRRHKQEIKNADDFEDLVLSHRYECAHNDRWGWSCDGGATLQYPDSPYGRSHYFALLSSPDSAYRTEWLSWYQEVMEHTRKRYQEIQRK